MMEFIGVQNKTFCGLSGFLGTLPPWSIGGWAEAADCVEEWQIARSEASSPPLPPLLLQFPINTTDDIAVRQNNSLAIHVHSTYSCCPEDRLANERNFSFTQLLVSLLPAHAKMHRRVTTPSRIIRAADCKLLPPHLHPPIDFLLIHIFQCWPFDKNSFSACIANRLSRQYAAVFNTTIHQ